MRRKRLGTWTGFALVLAIFVLATGLVVQKAGCNQISHYALVRALADGTTQIDEWQAETCDKSWFQGHFYSNKAPGLAFVALPFYLLLDTAGIVPDENPDATWALGILVNVLMAAGLLALVRVAAERIEPGTGTATALLLGLTTLVLPFSTLMFAHILGALVLFAAFTLAWDGRRLCNWRRTLLAGIVAGYAVVVEYPLGLISVLIGLYVLAGPARIRSITAFGAGGAIGILPLIVYNLAAFGSATHLSYRYSVINAGQSGHDVVYEGGDGTFFGIGTPSIDGLAEVLASARGLFVVTPIVALAVASLPLLWRRGLRPEAALAAGALLVAVLWNAGFRPASGTPLGGDVPGPRYLVPVLPFAILAVAPALRLLPRTTAVLAAISGMTMIVATLTEPLLGNDRTRTWLDLAADGEFTRTALTFAGLGSGWVAALPALAGFAALLVLGAAAIEWACGIDSWRHAFLAAIPWALVASFVPDLVRESVISPGVSRAAIAVAICAGVLALALWLVSRVSSGRLQAPGEPLLPTTSA